MDISHDDQIEDYVTVAPGVNIAGNVTIHEGAYIGFGTSIREKITIGPWSVIGGGAFVKGRHTREEHCTQEYLQNSKKNCRQLFR